MNLLHFFKYQATGNDFIMIDNREQKVDRYDISLPQKLCHRKFGIGADGLILIENHAEYDFEMVYFNSDGSQSMCGNGSRCAVKFARTLDIIGQTTTFLAIDGPHEADFDGGWVNVKMGDVKEVQHFGNDIFVNTGSPHYIRKVEDLENFPVVEEGRAIRNGPEYLNKGGTNVNFVQAEDENTFDVRTYERGVEDETYSCGTGVTAVAIALGKTSPVKLNTVGGPIEVAFKKMDDGGFGDIYLKGPAQEVFRGTIDI